MAHFARVADGVVLSVHLVADEVIIGANGAQSEVLGQEFLANLWGYDSAELVQCSYEGDMRNVYPGVGFLYIETLDVFVSPSPYLSWVLDEATCQWAAPTPKPDGEYVWDEQAGEWVEA
jgi:hypothetical protein